MKNKLISAPLTRSSCSGFPVIQYADDTVIIMPACGTQLLQVKNLLLHYTAYTGLRINYEKSIMIPINTSAQKMEHLATVLGCAIGSIPFTYLGLPLILTKPGLEDFLPIVKRIDQRLTGCSNVLSIAEKLILVKSVFASLPIFYMSTLSLPMGIVDME